MGTIQVDTKISVNWYSIGSSYSRVGNFRVARLEVCTPGTVDGIKNAELSRRVKLPDM